MKKYLDMCSQNMLCAFLSAYLFVVIILVLIFVVIAYVRPTHAHDAHHPDLDSFYSDLKDQRGNSCCNMSDCHEAEAEIRLDEDRRGSHWWAQLATKNGSGEWQSRPEWMQIPDDKIIKHENPTGRAIFCHTVSWKINFDELHQLDPTGILVRCFLPPTES